MIYCRLKKQEELFFLSDFPFNAMILVVEKNPANSKRPVHQPDTAWKEEMRMHLWRVAIAPRWRFWDLVDAKLEVQTDFVWRVLACF